MTDIVVLFNLLPVYNELKHENAFLFSGFKRFLLTVLETLF
jgi:hypothetical protein